MENDSGTPRGAEGALEVGTPCKIDKTHVIEINKKAAEYNRKSGEHSVLVLAGD